MTLDAKMRTPEGLRAAALEWFEVHVLQDDAEAWSAKYNKEIDRKHTTSAGPLIWLKNRMMERMLFSFGGSRGGLEMPGCELHVAFLFLEETEEMLCRLRTKERTKTPDESVARSKIGKTNSKIQPIDATAATVAEWKDEWST